MPRKGPGSTGPQGPELGEDVPLVKVEGDFVHLIVLVPDCFCQTIALDVVLEGLDPPHRFFAARRAGRAA